MYLMEANESPAAPGGTAIPGPRLGPEVRKRTEAGPSA